MKNILRRGGCWGAIAVFGALAIALVAPSASARCVMHHDDFVSLRKSKSGLQNQAQVDAMSAKAQIVLCQTRDLWHRTHANGDKLDGPPVMYSPMFLSPAELKIVVKLINDFIAAKLGVTLKQ